MPSPFASGKNAKAACDRCGLYFKLPQLKGETVKRRPINNRVCSSCWDPDHPQLLLGTFPINDPQAVRDPRPDMTYTLSGLNAEGYVSPGSRAFPQAWNEDDMASGLALDAYDSLTVTAPTPSSGYLMVRSQNSHTAGKFYWQAYLVRGTNLSSANTGAGFAESGTDLETALGAADTSYGLATNGDATTAGVAVATAVLWEAGGWVRFAIDFDAGKIWVGDETAWVGDPEAGTGATWTFTAGTELFAATQLLYDGDSITANFGSTRQFNTAPAGFNPF